jgi:hypothetical protein
VIGREGFLHFGIPDNSIYVYRPDEDYGRIPGRWESMMYGGYSCRRTTPAQGKTASSIVEDFIAGIKDGRTSTQPLKEQIHVMEIVLSAYRTGSVSRAERLKTTL